MFEDFKEKVKVLKKQVGTLYIAYTDKRVKWYKKAFLLLILIYALSPIDLIPDFVPILGLLDDFILIPLGIFLAIKMIPRESWEECEKQVEDGISIDKKYKIAGAVLISTLWGLIILKIIFVFID